MVKPNLIIAGTVKGGTTSLFSYLEKHPDICGSKVKETCFFLPARYGKERLPLSDYEKFFAHCSEDTKYVMESTPGYLDGGAVVAQDIKESIGCPKIIFVLRNPSDRLFSFFRYQKAQMNLPKDMIFSEYLRVCQSISVQERKKQVNDAYWGIDGGMYIDYLPAWFDILGEKNIKVVFFDDLTKNPKGVILSLLDWLEIDKRKLKDINYGVENRTVPYCFAWLHRYAIIVNKALEPLLRTTPLIKKWIRAIYYALNSGGNIDKVTDKEKLVVERIYMQKNHDLEVFLRKRGYRSPSWQITKSNLLTGVLCEK